MDCPADKLRCHGPRDCRLIVRPALSRHSGVESGNSRAVPDSALGWLLFDSNDKRGFVEVSLDAITSVVMRGVYLDKSVPDLPRRVQTDLLGRGLGRVIAREIGHWRMGREHARRGLMKESLNPQDLIDWVAGRLPRGWTAGECGEPELTAVERSTSRFTVNVPGP